MLSKFEAKTPRVKGLSFHPKRPWILASLYNGAIHLYDYKLGTLIDKFEEHEGPVRSVNFHPTQPLFVSGGDDYKIRVWNWKQRRCLFALTGHLDYVRTVFFHHEHPWIVSASDDQTIRIWNWQSRNCICILTGHNHYVMCAQFHPKDDLVLSASLDQTVRVWDISGLVRKNTTKKPSIGTHEFQRNPTSSQPDIFGNADYLVKFVLEGHDRGVNWASWHPTLPLIVSGSDDRQVKLWRLTETKAWEVDSCRGHFNNVSCAIFHPKAEVIVSNSEDKTLRIWDMAKRSAIVTFRRENDRFWLVTSHPELAVFGAAHDTGFVVFKIERERPASAIANDQLFFVKEKFVKMCDLNTGSETPVITLKKSGPLGPPYKTLSYNSAENAIILCNPEEQGSYELYNLPKGGMIDANDGNNALRGTGHCAIFVARNRFAVLDKTNQTIFVKDLRNEITKQFKSPPEANNIYYAGMKSILIVTAESVILYDMELRQEVSVLAVAKIRQCIWSQDMSMVALVGKHAVVIANKQLQQLSQIHESISVKGGAWDEVGVFIYTTLNHIKYLLPQGDYGIIKTLAQPVYVQRVKGSNIYVLDRESTLKTIIFDPTEYQFKLALVKKQYDQVLSIIRNSTLVGQSVISYLQKKGFSEIALHFVKDPKTRFDLSLECGNLDVAFETAKTLDQEAVWKRLGDAALKVGNQEIVETTYQRTKSFDKLSFLYLATGNQAKLAKMMKIAEVRGDLASKFQNAMFLGDVEEQIRVYRESGQLQLAYLTAKTHGLTDVADEILKQAGLDHAPQVPQPGKLLRPPNPILKQFQMKWPIKNPEKQKQFDIDQVAPVAAASPVNTGEELGGWGDDLDLPLESPNSKDNPDAVGDGGWDMGGDLDISNNINYEQSDDGHFIMPTPGVAIQDLWYRNSSLASDHIVAGNFESAMQLLNRQVGIVNFNLLKPLFMQVYSSSKTYQSGNDTLPPLVFPMTRQWSEDNNKILPYVCVDFERIADKLNEAMNMTTAGRFSDAIILIKTIIHSIVFLAGTPTQEAQKIVDQCREYITGLRMEISRKELNPESDAKRIVELAAYFTHCGLKPAHLILSLRSAMALSYKMKNFGSALIFARRLLEMNPATQVAQQAKTIQTRCERTPTDEVPLDYDPHNPFDVCVVSFTPIMKGSASIKCAYCQSLFKNEYKGTVCPTCDLTFAGSIGSGLRTEN